MELVTFAKEVLQDIAEYGASHRLGQSAIKQVDRALSVIEKCARWAVPPPLDQDEPQPELVRPLPWIFFLTLLVTLRVTRESISILNLVMGKPPLRSADVVMYIQSKRRYLRTLKYQGNRMMRARTSTPPNPEGWYSRAQALFEFTMCFRSQQHYGNNNTTRVSNNDEVLVVKRKRPERVNSGEAGTDGTTAAAGAAAGGIDRLLERMMLDLDADSEDDAAFTLNSESTDRIQDTKSNSKPTAQNGSSKSESPEKVSSAKHALSDHSTKEESESLPKSKSPDSQVNKAANKSEISDKSEVPEVETQGNGVHVEKEHIDYQVLQPPVNNVPRSPKEASENMLRFEKCSVYNDKRIANGQTTNASKNKKKGLNHERRDPTPENISAL